MTDKELLELAAKAAGYEFTFSRRLATTYEWMLPDSMFIQWNPLEDDGQALRLAVKLGLSIDTTENVMVDERNGFGEYEKATDVWFVDPKTAQTFSAMEVHEYDPYTPTRRAIVRASAEIGKTL